MKICDRRDIRPVFSSKEITGMSPYILQTEDGCYIGFSRDRKCQKPYNLEFDRAEAHRFYTIERAMAAQVEIATKFYETCTIHSL